MPMGRSVYPIADTKILRVVGLGKDSVQVSMLSAITKNRTHTMDISFWFIIGKKRIPLYG